MQISNRVVAAVLAAGIVAVFAAWFVAADDEDGARLQHLRPAAQDAMVENVDVSRIEKVQRIDDHTLTVIADGGKRFSMTLTAECPALEGATTVGFVTDGWHGLDRFTAIAVDGEVCPLKDFRPAA